jgi:hypothetical protein
MTTDKLKFHAHSAILEAYPLLDNNKRGRLYNAVVLSDGRMVVPTSILDGSPTEAILLSDGFNSECVTTIREPLNDKVSILYHTVDGPAFHPDKPTISESAIAILSQSCIHERHKCHFNWHCNAIRALPGTKRSTEIPFSSVILSKDRSRFLGFVLDRIDGNMYNYAAVV